MADATWTLDSLEPVWANQQVDDFGPGFSDESVLAVPGRASQMFNVDQVEVESRVDKQLPDDPDEHRGYPDVNIVADVTAAVDNYPSTPDLIRNTFSTASSSSTDVEVKELLPVEQGDLADPATLTNSSSAPEDSYTGAKRKLAAPEVNRDSKRRRTVQQLQQPQLQLQQQQFQPQLTATSATGSASTTSAATISTTSTPTTTGISAISATNSTSTSA
jgi:hypothetical protein